MAGLYCHSAPCGSFADANDVVRAAARREAGAPPCEASEMRGACEMKIATWRGENRFTIDDAPEPTAGPGQVVVAVHAAGICGTDVHATQGLFPWQPPLVLGHEYTGVVREVGRGVSRTLVGRVVGCEPSYGCGERS